MKRLALVTVSFFGGALLTWGSLAYLRCFFLARIGYPDAAWRVIPFDTITLFAVELLLVVVTLVLVARKAFLDLGNRMKEDASLSLGVLDLRKVFQSGVCWVVFAVVVSAVCSALIYFFLKPDGEGLSRSDPLTRFLMPQAAEAFFSPDRIKLFASGEPGITEVGRAAAEACVYGQLLILIVAVVVPYVRSARAFEQGDLLMEGEPSGIDRGPRGGGKTNGW